MPSTEHEALVEALTKTPSVVVELLAAVGVRVPAGAALRIGDSNLSLTRPLTRHADLVLTWSRGKRVTFYAVVEVQRSRNSRKRRRWHQYLANASGAFNCVGVVIVIALRRDVASWAAREFPIDPRYRWAPVVVGPTQLPVPELEAMKQAPVLALLAGLAHGGSREGVPVLKLAHTALQANASLEPREVSYYWEVILGAAGTSVARLLREDMDLDNYKPTTAMGKRIFAGYREAKAEGMAKGRAESILAVLKARGLRPTALEAARIRACKDLTRLSRWIERAATAEAVPEIFGRSRK